MLRNVIRHSQKALGVVPRGWYAVRGWSSQEGGADSVPDAVQQMTEAASRNDLDKLLGIVESAGESFDGQAVEAALRQVESCTQDMSAEDRQNLYGSKTFQMLADMAVSSAGHATPEVLASTIGVLGRMGFADEMVLDSLARHLMPGVHNLGAEHIAQLVEGLKNADHSPSVLLLDEVHERLSEMQQSMPQDDTKSIHQGLQQLGRDDDNLPNARECSQPDRIKY